MANGTSAPCSCARLAPENSIRAKEDSIKAKIVAKLARQNPVSANPSPYVRQTIGRVDGLLLSANLRIRITDHYLSDPRSCQTKLPDVESELDQSDVDDVDLSSLHVAVQES